jgi:quinol monooxygenase YgiN
MKITKKVTFIAKEGCIEEVKQLLTDMVAPSIKEAGCLFYYIVQSKQNPRKFFAVESWESADALAGHAKTAHYAHYKANYEPFVEHKYSEELDILDAEAYGF